MTDIIDFISTKRQAAAIQSFLQEKYHQKFEVEKDMVRTEYKYLLEGMDISEYEWFRATVLEGNMAGRDCVALWNKKGIKDCFAYELIEEYRQECNAIDQFQCRKWWTVKEPQCSYQYTENGVSYNHPIYDIWYPEEVKHAYTQEEIQQITNWIHKIQDQDMLFAHSSYIKLLFRGLHGEEYVLRLSQDYDEVDYHRLVEILEQFRWEGRSG